MDFKACFKRKREWNLGFHCWSVTNGKWGCMYPLQVFREHGTIWHLGAIQSTCCCSCTSTRSLPNIALLCGRVLLEDITSSHAGPRWQNSARSQLQVIRVFHDRMLAVCQNIVVKVCCCKLLICRVFLVVLPDNGTNKGDCLIQNRYSDVWQIGPLCQRKHFLELSTEWFKRVLQHHRD